MQRFRREQRFLVYRLSPSGKTPPPRCEVTLKVVNACRLRFGYLSSLLTFMGFVAMPYLLLRYMTRDTKLWLAYRGDKLVHVSWVVPGTRCGRYKFIPREGYMIGPCKTAPSARGKGIYPSVLENIASSELVPSGGFWIFCEVGNLPSIRGIEKVHARKVGTFVMIKTWWGLRGSIRYTPADNLELEYRQ